MIRKSFVRTMYQTNSAVPQFDATNPVALHYMLDMGLQENGDYSCLNPLGLLPSTAEFIKLLNQWQEFRVKSITLQWIPSVKGNPIRVETGLTIVDNAAYLSYLTYLIMPSHAPARYNLSTGTLASNAEMSDFDFFNGSMTNEMLDQAQNPRPEIHAMNNPWKKTWKAQVPAMDRYNYSAQNLTTGPVWGTDYIQSMQSGKWKAFPWLPLVNSGGDASSSISITGLLAWLRQPYVAMRNDKTWAWQSAVGVAANGMYGRWRLSSTWEFRKRRASTSQLFVDYNTTTGVLTVASPSVHPMVSAMTST